MTARWLAEFESLLTPRSPANQATYEYIGTISRAKFGLSINIVKLTKTVIYRRLWLPASLVAHVYRNPHHMSLSFLLIELFTLKSCIGLRNMLKNISENFYNSIAFVNAWARSVFPMHTFTVNAYWLSPEHNLSIWSILHVHPQRPRLSGSM